MAQPLEALIKSALRSSSRLADVDSVIAAVDAEILAIDKRRKREQALSLSPNVATPDARVARDAVADLEHDIRRLTASLEALNKRRDAILEDQSYEERRQRYVGARDRRDALVERIRHRYPAIVVELVELAQDIDAIDAECSTANHDKPRDEPHLVGAEVIARGFSGNGYWGGVTPVMYLKDIKLPFLSSHGLALPKPTYGNALAAWKINMREARAAAASTPIEDE